jgi:glycosyltransferase involved in cell wall biosynthesis
MKLIYITDFTIEGNSGKNKATREKGKALSELVGKDNFKFFHPARSSSILQKTIGRLLFDVKTAAKILMEDRCDVVIQRAVFLPCVLIVAKLRGIILIGEFHADFKEEIPYLNKNAFEKKILHLISYLYNWNYHLMDGIIYNHPYLKLKFDTIFSKPSIYSYNGSNFKEFIPKVKKTSKILLQLPQNEFIFLFLGSVSKWHGVEFLINIFNEERLAKIEVARLYIVGIQPSPYTEMLKSMSKNKNVTFIDAVDNLTALNYINASDICLLPVNHIRTSPGSPLKLYDYIACGKPVIAQSGLAGYADEVTNFNLGYTVDFTNASRAAFELVKIMNDDLESFSKNNRLVAVTKLNWNTRMTDWINFVNSLRC